MYIKRPRAGFWAMNICLDHVLFLDALRQAIQSSLFLAMTQKEEASPSSSQSSLSIVQQEA